MKKIFFFLALSFVCLTNVNGQDLMITGVFDGPLTGGLPKGVEIYVINDIADLSSCGLGSANNGGGTDGEEFTFPAVAATAGDYIYVASESTEFANYFGFAPDYTSSAMGINGDDAVELFCGGVVVDLYGDINVDGNGTAWEYEDGFSSRPIAAGPSATFNVADWTTCAQCFDGTTSPTEGGWACGECGAVEPPACGATLGTISVVCDANTAGTDTYTVTIPYTGSDATVLPTAPGSNSITGDFSTVDGTITLVYDEGVDWALVANTADCNLDAAGLSPVCEPIVAGSCDIIISGVFDGPLSGGQPKFVEIYIVNDIADLSIYGLGSANNGGGTDGEEFTFPAVAATAGDYIYVAANTLDFESYMGFAPDYADGAMGINGDDAIELFCNGAVIDVFGDINVDGNGEPWEYTDSWASRDITSCPSNPFDLSMWSFGDANVGPTIDDDATPFPAGEGPPPVCGITGLGDAVITCSAITAGPDQYTVTIPYTGSDAIATVSATGADAVTADLSVANDAIVLTYTEPNAWSLTITGNACDYTLGAAAPTCEPGGPCDAECGNFPFNQ